KVALRARLDIGQHGVDEAGMLRIGRRAQQPVRGADDQRRIVDPVQRGQRRAVAGRGEGASKSILSYGSTLFCP
ncbi:hypothetical protein, partial [Escherichia ruysiae]|uniref:hypothetical protein n=1 Tax=Escherichia ruysiae TaxID=2608867 RepID=UPI00215B087C